MPSDQTPITITIPVESGQDRTALEQALLRARATELAEVRRLEVRLSAGYGDATTRATMSTELDRARMRWMMLDRLLSALRSGTVGEADPRADSG